MILSYSDSPYFIHHFQEFGKPLGISLKLHETKIITPTTVQPPLLTYPLKAAFTYNQPSIISIHNLALNLCQKLQVALSSLASVELARLLFPMLASLNPWISSIMTYHNSHLEFTIFKPKHNVFALAQYYL
jgi:hypothetical protein